MMQATSRESLRALRARFDELAGQADVQALRGLGDELTGVVGVLAEHRQLRKALSDAASAESDRTGLADRLFGGKIGERAQQVLRHAVELRWSKAGDLVDAIEILARQSLLTAAERENTLDETEDELFRFGRLLETENRLRDLLGDESKPVEGRLRLLHGLLDGKATQTTLELLDQAVRSPRDRSLDALVEQLAEQAAARRERSVAVVTAAAPLSARQEERLAGVLSRIYGRTMSVQVEIDPEVLGGLVVRVGDEVIDGSVLSRLTKANQGLPT